MYFSVAGGILAHRLQNQRGHHVPAVHHLAPHCVAPAPPPQLLSPLPITPINKSVWVFSDAEFVIAESELMKHRDHSIPGYHPRWFILTDKRLMYFKGKPSEKDRRNWGWKTIAAHPVSLAVGSATCTGVHLPWPPNPAFGKMPRGSCPVISIKEIAIPQGDDGCFELSMFNGDKWKLKTGSNATRLEWISAIQSCNPELNSK